MNISFIIYTICKLAFNQKAKKIQTQIYVVFMINELLNSYLNEELYSDLNFT